MDLGRVITQNSANIFHRCHYCLINGIAGKENTFRDNLRNVTELYHASVNYKFMNIKLHCNISFTTVSSIL